MASKIDVYNMALGHIGTNSTVADELERSPERIACGRYWDTCRDSLFAYKSMPWNFAVTIEALADIGGPPTGWEFRYRYPNDCITAMELFAESVRAVSVELRPKYQVQWEQDGLVIFTDLAGAKLQYVKRVREVERWPSTFVDAMSYRLAAMIAMPLKNDNGLRNDMLALAEQFTQIAMAATLNEAQADGPIASIYERELHA